ncbi:major tail protein [Arthrobacter phage Savage2526]|uniref:Major tail protein n=10 Tax=Korravirus TaxID=1982076 RepID=A0A3S9U9Z1_9CAUD|nr:major tail protein [Arthrobacter phage Glenn]YP_010050551.1 major tail protein [Arthrobacter phage Wawa]ALY10034.1 major tail protein [Arthrobacter phage RAP15]AOT24105.1 major tail protein [Arthrobacter phage Vallejo]ASR83460.1 major tail protein [Arthrobacter phage Dino]ATW58951.1 major tail protein [Arthrobacter phage MeganNoll]AZS07059.1 major tail protein [Arthrobacter phage Cholula]AZS10130.1 major tail protein [Arthrobacter phage Savage2526]AZS11463.1 major tail protein [Arthrobac
MTTKVANVFTGAPDQLVTGAILRSPVGTALPSSIASTLDPAYVDSGYIGPDGLKLTPNTKLSDIKDWSGTTIRKVLEEFAAELAWQHLELSTEALRAYFGDANVAVMASQAFLSAPVLTKGATATTGGTLTAGTYYWRITAINANGETLGSNEITATTTGTTSTQVMTWGAVAGATGYKVYRGTFSGGQDKLVTTLGAVTTYTDTGTVGSAAAVPTVNTTGNGLMHKVQLNGADMPVNTWVFRIKDGPRKIQIVVPLGQVTERGEISFTQKDAVQLPVKLTTYPDALGNNVYIYTDTGVYTA